MTKPAARRLFTVTCDGEAVCVVSAIDDATALRIAVPLLAAPEAANDEILDLGFLTAGLAVRRSNDAEAYRFAVEARKFSGEVALAALPL